MNFLILVTGPYDFLFCSYSGILYFTLYYLQVDFDISNHWAEPIIYSSKDDWTANLNNILEWSPFATKEDLMMQVSLTMESRCIMPIVQKYCF